MLDHLINFAFIFAHGHEFFSLKACADINHQLVVVTLEITILI